MSEETTTEQLAEIEGQGEVTPATGYTPPEGWRVLQVGEALREGDVIVHKHDAMYATARAGGWVGANQRYIRPIEPEPQPEPVQGGLVRDVTHLLEESGVLDSAKAEQQIEELRSEVSYVQNLLGTERRRVAELKELVGSLRTINEAQEKAFTAAGKENTALRNQLAAVKAELVQERLERNRWHNQVLRVTAELDEKTTQCEILQIELDAAQQVPADSPELRQLRADLADVTRERDTYRDGYDRVLSDLRTMRETAKAEAVEAIVEWLEPIRTCGSPALATAVISNLPHIMRHLTGLAQD